MSDRGLDTASIFYDSLCPVCDLEIRLLRRKDKKNQIDFIDIAAPDFDPSRYQRTIDDFIGTIHGYTRDNRMVTGLDVFVEIYDILGWGWIYRWTRWPIVKPIADLGYIVFAKIRPKFSKFRPSCELGAGAGRCK
jgi:predicted DCC family thiol-disulfide oxidoreductase YuxK